MKVLVPKNVDVKRLIKSLDPSRTKAENLKNKIYYLLSNLVNTNENYFLNEKNKGYRNISSVRMKQIFGNLNYYLILDLLQDPEDPIIESNDSWQKSDNGKRKGFCKGYRLTPKYNTGDYCFKTLPEKYEDRVDRYLHEKTDDNFDETKYAFLYRQFDQHRLTFDPRVYDYIRSFGRELLSKAGNNEFQIKIILNLIGRWQYYIERFDRNDLWYRVSPENHRLNSSLTHLKRQLRQFLLCDGQSMGMIDLSASQPYILSSVMSNDFLAGNIGEYNLSSIYPEVYNFLLSKGCISSSSYDAINNFTYKSYSGTSVNFSFDGSSGSSTEDNQLIFSFMWCKFFNNDELESIREYQSAPFESDFYRYLIDTSKTPGSKKPLSYESQRKKLKSNMMYVLYDDKKNHRNNNKYIKMCHDRFPGVDKWICMMHQLIGNDRFAYLLQKTESYLMLEVICREFHEKHPSAPVFTIHDAICTLPQYLPDLKELILERFPEITGAKVGLKSSLLTPELKSKPEEIDEEWQKIRPVNTLEKFMEISFYVFPGNIEKGSEFLDKK